MSILRKILNLGVDDPLALSMGHPMTDRVKRLTRGKGRRGGGVAVLTLIAGGLAITSIAKEPSLLKQAGPLMAEFWTVASGAENPEKLISVELTDHQMMVNVHHEGTDMAFSLVEPKKGDTGDKFEALLEECFSYAPSNKLPIVYFINEKLVERDTSGQSYLIWCQPGDVGARALITSDDIATSKFLLHNAEDYEDEQLRNAAYIVGVHIGEAIMSHAKQ